MAKIAISLHAQLDWSADAYPNDREEAVAILHRAGYDMRGVEAAVVNQLFFMMQWVRFGMPVYRPTLDLAAGLAMTDPSDVRGEDWRLPYGAFLIHVPYDLWVVAPPEGMEAYRNGISMIAVQSYMHKDREVIDVQAWTRDGVGQFSRGVAPADRELLGEWVYRAAHKAATGIGTWELAPDEQDTSEALLRLVINLCLYITDRGPGRPEPRYTTKAKRRRDTSGRRQAEPEVWILGKEVKLDREVLAAARVRATGTRAEWRIASSSIVQGHHKMQPHGPGRTLRKRIWIEPYRRGAGPRLTHMYVVGPLDESDDE